MYFSASLFILATHHRPSFGKDTKNIYMSKITSINLSNQNLTKIPDEVYSHRHLRKLNLSGNKITNISSQIAQLKRLKVLNLSNNNLTQLHAGVFKLPNLETLIISENKIKTLPQQIATLTELKVLIAYNNKLSDTNLDRLPLSLTRLNLTNNSLSKSDWLHRLSSLHSLWIGGNLIPENTICASIKTIPSLMNLYLHSSTSTMERGNALKSIISVNQVKSEITYKRASIFISYCHQDKVWLTRLQTHLKVLNNLGFHVNYWDDTKIKTGDTWLKEIEQNLNSATIAILLVSTDFLASDFVMRKEIPQLLKNADERGVHIFPLILAPCMFTDSDIAQFQAVNSPEEALEELEKTKQEKVFVKLMQDVKKHITA